MKVLLYLGSNMFRRNYELRNFDLSGSMIASFKSFTLYMCYNITKIIIQKILKFLNLIVLKIARI